MYGEMRGELLAPVAGQGFGISGHFSSTAWLLEASRLRRAFARDGSGEPARLGERSALSRR
jgi:hypothetical protein